MCSEEEGHISWEVFELLLSQIENYLHLKSVVFIGYGEPLLHPRILDMLRAFKGLGLRTELVTKVKKALREDGKLKRAETQEG